VTVEVVDAQPGGDFTVQVTSPKIIGTVPDVFELTAEAASKLVTDAGFVPRFTVEPGSKGLEWVVSQSPNAGSIEPVGTTVSMTLRGGPIE